MWRCLQLNPSSICICQSCSLWHKSNNGWANGALRCAVQSKAFTRYYNCCELHLRNITHLLKFSLLLPNLLLPCLECFETAMPLSSTKRPAVINWAWSVRSSSFCHNFIQYNIFEHSLAIFMKYSWEMYRKVRRCGMKNRIYFLWNGSPCRWSLNTSAKFIIP